MDCQEVHEESTKFEVGIDLCVYPLHPFWLISLDKLINSFGASLEVGNTLLKPSEQI